MESTENQNEGLLRDQLSSKQTEDNEEPNWTNDNPKVADKEIDIKLNEGESNARLTTCDTKMESATDGHSLGTRIQAH
jgi:hypothetical protein